MKIVYLSESFLPSRSANSIHVMRMCEAFAYLRHEVYLIGRRPVDPDLFSQDLHDFYGVEKSFSVKRFPNLRFRGKNRFSRLFALYSSLTAKRLRARMAYCRSLLGCAYSIRLGLPTIYEIHTAIENLGDSGIELFRQILVSGKLLRVVTISDALRRHCQENFPISDDLILVAHDAANPASVGKKANLTSDAELHVGYVGHLYDGRGLSIIEEMAGRCPWAWFHIVGGEEKDVERWRMKFGDLGNFTFYGFLPPAQVTQYQQAFDVLLAPYQMSVQIAQGGGNTGRWMSPLKIFEYMAAGKPILCSDLPVLREVLHHEKNALLCPPDNAEKWVDALERVRQDEPLRETLGRNAREDFLARHTWRKRAERVLENLAA